MFDVVLDSSVLVKLVLPEVGSDLAFELTQSVLARGGRVVALDLAVIESAQSIWKRHHRGQLTSAEVNSTLGELRQKPLKIASALQLIEYATSLAIAFDKSVYDMLFVALAAKLGIDGLTADVPLYHTVSVHFPNIRLLQPIS